MSNPVPGTGRRKRRKYKNARTGTVGSKALPHRFGDEGEKGPIQRRLVRRAETRLWRRELL
ncbi:hypothetical protein [Streptomyces venezuelae]|uniref:hypothetical protein n=1 Tax=Streptomyces venezuelae TaxID=54571 RepID=UPI003426A72A